LPGNTWNPLPRYSLKSADFSSLRREEAKTVLFETNKKMINRYLNEIRKIIEKEMQDENVAIALFGSFAMGTQQLASDIDIALIPKGKLNKSKVADLREKLTELTVPYSVDLVDFDRVSEQFKKIALRDAQWWRK